MTHTLTNWLWRVVSGAAHSSRVRPSAERPTMTIEVKRLPDYLWRDVGFQGARRPQEDAW